MNKTEIRERMSQADLKVYLDSRELGELEDWLKQPGFHHYIGLVLGARQAQLLAVANAPLGDAEKSCRASVLQGTIKGLDLALECFVDLFPDAGNKIEEGLRNG